MVTDGITIIGNTNIDVIIADTLDLPAPGTERVVSSVSIRLGGSAGNFAVRCAGLDFPTTLVSRVGDDTSVMVLEAELRLPLLETRLLRTPGEPSGITVAVEAQGRDRALVDIFLPNDDELHGLMDDGNTERAARRLSLTTNTLVAVKMGARGAGLASPDGGWSAQPAARVDVVDSTGAGDGFNAAFLVSAARGAGWPVALAAGVGYATEMVATAPERRAAVVLPTATLS